MATIDRVDVRGRLKERRSPYWKRVSVGRYVGFRRLSRDTPGTWLARFYDGSKYQQKPLGDFATIGERERFDAAKRAAEEWFRHLDMGGTTARVTVKDVCESYVKQIKVDNSEASSLAAEGVFKRFVFDDPLAAIDLQKVLPRHVAQWKDRTLARGGSHSYFNRNATTLRAALNLAYRRRDVASDHAWREELKPFKNADGRRTLYLDAAKRRRLVNHACDELKPLLTALALLPLRVGEAAHLRVEDLDVKQRILNVPISKTEARAVPLSAEALAHFAECAKSKTPKAWLIARADGKQWDRFGWRDLVKDAAKAAKLPRAVCAYTIRHSVITDLVTGGLDLFHVAKIAGTSVAMIEKHYGKLRQEHARKALAGLTLGTS